MSAISNTFSNPQLQLNKLFTIDSKKEASKNACINALMKTAAAVALVATIAIAVTILTFAFLATGGTTMPLLLVPVAFAAIPLWWAASKLWQKSKEYSNIATIEKGVEQARLDFMNVLTSNGTKEIDCAVIRKHLESLGINHDRQTLQNMIPSLPQPKNGEAALTEDDALKAFIPVIARMNYWWDSVYSSKIESDKHCYNKCDSDETRSKQFAMAYADYEMTTIPSALNAAIAMNVLAHPFSKECCYGDLGKINAKPLDLRINDHRYLRDDSYFVFHEKERQPIPFQIVDGSIQNLVDTMRYRLERVKLLSQPSEAEIDNETEEHIKPEVNEFKLLNQYLFEPTMIPALRQEVAVNESN